MFYDWLADVASELELAYGLSLFDSDGYGFDFYAAYEDKNTPWQAAELAHQHYVDGTYVDMAL